MADEGKAMAKHEGMVVFIDKAVPGDIVDVYVKKKKKILYRSGSDGSEETFLA